MRRTIFEEEHDLFRSAFRQFLDKELVPRNDEFEQAGAQAYRVWEGEVEQEAAERVLRDKPTWITMGGKGTPCEVGDTTPARLGRILELEPQGVLVNDPLLMIAPDASGIPSFD